jgi:hypothetical protein
MRLEGRVMPLQPERRVSRFFSQPRKRGPAQRMAPYFPASAGIRGNDKEARNIAVAGLCSGRTLSHRGLRCFADLIP